MARPPPPSYTTASSSGAIPSLTQSTSHGSASSTSVDRSSSFPQHQHQRTTSAPNTTFKDIGPSTTASDATVRPRGRIRSNASDGSSGRRQSGGSADNYESSSSSSSAALQATLIQPRVAVVLKVPSPWHPWLFALRLSSILPAVWWGLPSALRLALRLVTGEDKGDCPLTETALATIWCFASGYLSFFFTDCLMSRWLINYTPQATIVRLITINAVNAYVTSTVLSLTGGFDDSRLLLPGWIGIATTLTVCYHITHQKINIRKETSTSVNVFSIASYITMVTLLIYLHVYQSSYPEMPFVTRGKWAWGEVTRLWAQFKSAVERADL